MVMIAVVTLVTPDTRIMRKYPLWVRYGLPGAIGRVAREDVPALERFWWWLRASAIVGVVGFGVVEGLWVVMLYLG
jgi:hypothetical protein